MSPVTHGLIGWLISQPLQERRHRVIVTGAAVIADIDGLSLAFGIDAYQRWHHTFGHNLFFGLALALTAATLTHSKKCALLVILSFHSHLLTDLLGSGAGWEIQFFWPVSQFAIEFAPPLQWELNSWQNFVITLICIFVTGFIGLRKERTIVEVISPAVDAKIAKALSSRFKKAS